MTILDVREPESHSPEPLPLAFTDPCVAAIPIDIQESARPLLTDDLRPIVEGMITTLARVACDENMPVKEMVLMSIPDIDTGQPYLMLWFVLNADPKQTMDFHDRAEDPVEDWAETLMPEQYAMLDDRFHFLSHGMVMFSNNDAEALYELSVILAEQAERDGNELAYRTAVNRAYYAVFLLAREQTRTTTEFDVHAEVIRRVRRMRGNLMADALVRLRALRQEADYDFSATAAE